MFLLFSIDQGFPTTYYLEAKPLLVTMVFHLDRPKTYHEKTIYYNANAMNFSLKGQIPLISHLQRIPSCTLKNAQI